MADGHDGSDLESCAVSSDDGGISRAESERGPSTLSEVNREPSDDESCELGISDDDSPRGIALSDDDSGVGDAMHVAAAHQNAQDHDELSEDGYHVSAVDGEWIPGTNCGQYFDQHKAPLTAQAQVFPANCYTNLRRLPKSTLKMMAQHLGVERRLHRHNSTVVAARLFCIGVNLPKNLVSKLQRSRWTPQERPREDETDGVAHKQAFIAVRVRVAEALACIHDGDPDTSYARRMDRICQIHGMDLGTKYNSTHFVKLVESLGQLVARTMQATEMQRCLPSLGVPSDLGLTWDGVSLGQASFSRHETLCLIGATYSRVSTSASSSAHGSCRLTTRLLAAPSFGQSHGGRAQVTLISEALHSHMARLDRAALSARVAIVGGDGATCIGGEDHRHQSTQAAELFMEYLHPAPRPGVLAGGRFLMATDWGLFHRIDVALKRSIESSAAAMEVFDLGKTMGSLFGAGEG